MPLFAAIQTRKPFFLRCRGFRFLFFLWICIPFASLHSQSGRPDSSNTADTLAIINDYYSVRGIEQDERRPVNRVRRVLHTAFYPPRKLVDILLTTAGFSAILIDEKKVVQKFEDVFYLYRRELGWFPVFNFVTGTPKGYGISLFYHKNYTSALIKTGYADEEIWGLKAKLSYTFFRRNYVWQSKVELRLDNDDDFRFYGIGSQPLRDPRSRFLENPAARFGFYQQRRFLVKYSLGVRTSPDWEFFLTTFYRKRSIRSPDDPDPRNLVNVFQVEQIPGFRIDAQHWYNELSFRYDNRELLKISSPGLRVEGYTGVSIGVKNDNSRLFRAGGDISAFIPVLRHNRLIVARLNFNMVESLEASRPIPFTEYPRQSSFRGANRKKLLRSDNYSLLSSLEYRWPLTYHLSGHLFVDSWIVGKTPRLLTIHNSPWAAGFSIEVHNQYSEFVRLTVSGGSEGLFLRGVVGFSKLYRDRADWR